MKELMEMMVKNVRDDLDNSTQEELDNLAIKVATALMENLSSSRTLSKSYEVPPP